MSIVSTAPIAASTVDGARFEDAAVSTSLNFSRRFDLFEVLPETVAGLAVAAGQVFVEADLASAPASQAPGEATDGPRLLI